MTVIRTTGLGQGWIFPNHKSSLAVEAARVYLAADDALLAELGDEPDSDGAPASWLVWERDQYAPARAAQRAAVDALARVTGAPANRRHRAMLRPLAEAITALDQARAVS